MQPLLLVVPSFHLKEVWLKLHMPFVLTREGSRAQLRCARACLQKHLALSLGHFGQLVSLPGQLVGTALRAGFRLERDVLLLNQLLKGQSLVQGLRAGVSHTRLFIAA